MFLVKARWRRIPLIGFFTIKPSANAAAIKASQPWAILALHWHSQDLHPDRIDQPSDLCQSPSALPKPTFLWRD
jgi:hypothetical protein